MKILSEISDTEELPDGVFPMNLKRIDHYQWKDPFLKAKYDMGAYHKGSFCGRSNIYLKLITCEDKIFILSIIQSYAFNWCHAYLLHQGMDRTELMNRQHLYWPGMIKSIQKEGTDCDTCQCTKRSNKKYDKLPANESEDTSRNKLCVFIIGPYVTRIKGQKDNLNLKAVTMIYPVTGWSKITQYDDKRAVSIANLAEITWLTRYPRQMELTYDQGSEFISHEFRKSLIETEYEITVKPSILVNPTPNAILEWIHQVLVNLVQTFSITETYVDEDDSWSGILAASAFAILSTTKRVERL